jgi:linoleoyl-CoA desaturase
MPMGRRVVRWLMGGLDYQIEHHLAPKLPHTIYPIVAPRLLAACEARGLDYRTHPSVTEAIRSHARWLRAMGRAPEGASFPSSQPKTW